MTLNHATVAALAARDARIAELFVAGVTLRKIGADVGMSDDAVNRARIRMRLPSRQRVPQRHKTAIVALTGPYRLGDATRADLPPVIPPDINATPQCDSTRPQQQVRLTMRGGGAAPHAKLVAIPDGPLPSIIRYHDKLFARGRGVTYSESTVWPIFDELDAVAA